MKSAGNPIKVSFNRLIQHFGSHAVKLSQIGVDQHFFATNLKDQSGQLFL
jgi:hypothetical protein